MTPLPSDLEVLDGEPVTSSPAAVALAAPASAPAPREPAVVPVRQAAALAATSFVAGAAAVAVAGRRARRLMDRRRRRRKGIVGEIVSSNSFLIDVHLVRRG